jgi:predicted phosphodiesterase
MQYLIEFSKQFSEVYLVSGNHEERLTKYFSKMVSLEVSSLVCTDILARMANGEEYNQDGTIKKHHDFDNVFYDSRTKFYMTVGKTLFVHPSKYKSKPGETVQACAQYFYGRFPFDSVVVGHTHQAGTFHYKSHLLIEQGCLCKALEYQVSPELTYGAQNNAYAVIHQDKDGNTDKRRSRHIWCDSLPKMNE